MINRIFSLMVRFMLIVLLLAGFSEAEFIIDGVHEASIDLPRIYFILKRELNGEPLKSNGDFALHFAFLDTGASGLLLSKETADMMGVIREPDARYSDVGVGGSEFFDVSEPLYLGTLDLDSDPEKTADYRLTRPVRMQIRQYEADEMLGPIDLIGVPAMADLTVILNSGSTNELNYFGADIVDSGDPSIPQVDFKVALRFGKYITPNDPENIKPLPDVAYNPVIDNIRIEKDGLAVTGSWVLDTGGMVSLISVKQAMETGLVNESGVPLVDPDFSLVIGGVGHTVEIPGFEIDRLIVPTLAGYDLVYKNAKIGVHDIGVFSEDTGEFEIIDGIFGSNFLAASFRQSDMAISATPFEHVIVDMRQGLLGFNVYDIYPLPQDYTQKQIDGDLNADYFVDYQDFAILTSQWLSDNCYDGNEHCHQADIIRNGYVNLEDYAIFAKDWRIHPPCGSIDNPWPLGDLNRDCRIDLEDLAIFSYEWLNECNELNWHCRTGDLDRNGFLDFFDFAILCNTW